jgi:hypothetical protein
MYKNAFKLLVLHQKEVKRFEKHEDEWRQKLHILEDWSKKFEKKEEEWKNKWKKRREAGDQYTA